MQCQTWLGFAENSLSWQGSSNQKAPPEDSQSLHFYFFHIISRNTLMNVGLRYDVADAVVDDVDDGDLSEPWLRSDRRQSLLPCRQTLTTNMLEKKIARFWMKKENEREKMKPWFWSPKTREETDKNRKEKSFKRSKGFFSWKANDEVALNGKIVS